MTPGYL